MMKRRFVPLAALLVAFAAWGWATDTSAQGPGCSDCVRLNHIQVLGTHNSYHLEPLPAVMAVIQQMDPNAAIAMGYSHRPLAEQLGALGVRQVELDVFADPGPVPLYAAPIGEALAKGPSSVPIAAMLAPGEKVMHIQDIDYRTTCMTLAACLQQIEDWSKANPYHLPILVLVEAKDDTLTLPPAIPGIGPIPPAAVPVPIGAAELQSIDNVIRSVFGADQLITPDDVRGSAATLEAAVLANGWPTLADSMGKVLFALDNTDEKRDAYIAGHTSLQGRVMFTSSDPGSPEAAFVKINDPVSSLAQIQDLVKKGYLVRTRADSDTVEARQGSTARRDAALASGAQFVSTDYPEPDADFGTGYVVDIPGGQVGRCNPVASPASCDASTFESAPVTPATPTPVAPRPPQTGQGTVAAEDGSNWPALALLVASGLAVAGGGAAAVRTRRRG